MHPEIAKKMRKYFIGLSLVFLIGFLIFLHGYLTNGWWLYAGLLMFLAPLPFLLAIVRIWSLLKRYR